MKGNNISSIVPSPTSPLESHFASVDYNTPAAEIGTAKPVHTRCLLDYPP